MVSIIAPVFLLLAVLSGGIHATDGGSSEKIIIHVPYKIHNHLHTHTNYKVIKVPEKEVENQHEATENEELKYLNKEIDSILSGTKIPPHIKHIEPQFKPQLFEPFEPATPSVPAQTFHDLKEGKKIEHYHQGMHGEAGTEGLTSPTRVPTYHTTVPDYQYGEGNLYYHTFATKAPFVPFYNAQIVNPTYQVEEKQSSSEKLSHKITPFESFGKSNTVSKFNKDAYIRSYIQNNPYTIRSGKFLPTTKSIKIGTTKLYTLPTLPTKTFVIPTTKSFLISTKKPPKTLFTNNEEYEHIGYLVVGENSQKFVGVNSKRK